MSFRVSLVVGLGGRSNPLPYRPNSLPAPVLPRSSACSGACLSAPLRPTSRQLPQRDRPRKLLPLSRSKSRAPPTQFPGKVRQPLAPQRESDHAASTVPAESRVLDSADV